MFFGKPWLTDDDAETRKWRYDRYQEVVAKYDWNKENEWGEDVPILPACHGTDVAVAEKICETGFAALSSLDAGWYVRPTVQPSPQTIFFWAFVPKKNTKSLVFPLSSLISLLID